MGKAHGAAVKAHVQTLILAPREAEFASVAGPARADGDALADPHALRGRAYRFDNARDFMAKHHWLAQAHDAKPAMIIIVQVRPANAADRDANANVIWAEFGDFDGFDPQILSRVSDDRAHDVPLRF
jgi:hypothetical protein